MQIENNTPFAHAMFPIWHRDRKIRPILVLKTGYQWDSVGQLTELTETDISIEPVDRYENDDAENASLDASADVVPFKDGFEILAKGTSAPSSKGLQQVAIRIQSPDGRVYWQKEVSVFGERQWKRSLLGWLPSTPKPLEPLKMAYELAFGGKHTENENKYWAQNPVGIGYSKTDSHALPHIESKPYLSNPKQTRLPAGFGPIAPNWEPRISRLKNLDAKAAANGLCPYAYPIDAKLYNAAPIDQQLEQVPPPQSQLVLEGWLGALEQLVIELPQARPSAQLNETTNVEWQWDTLIIDVDKQHLFQVWRAVLPITIEASLRAQVEISEMRHD